MKKKRRIKNLKKIKNKWTLSLIGMLLLAGSLVSLGYFVDKYGEVKGLMYSLPLSGSMIGIVLIVLGIILALKKSDSESRKKKR